MNVCVNRVRTCRSQRKCSHRLPALISVFDVIQRQSRPHSCTRITIGRLKFIEIPFDMAKNQIHETIYTEQLHLATAFTYKFYHWREPKMAKTEKKTVLAAPTIKDDDKAIQKSMIRKPNQSKMNTHKKNHKFCTRKPPEGIWTNWQFQQIRIRMMFCPVFLFSFFICFVLLFRNFVRLFLGLFSVLCFCFVPDGERFPRWSRPFCVFYRDWRLLDWLWFCSYIHHIFESFSFHRIFCWKFLFCFRILAIRFSIDYKFFLLWMVLIFQLC